MVGPIFGASLRAGIRIETPGVLPPLPLAGACRRGKDHQLCKRVINITNKAPVTASAKSVIKRQPSVVGPANAVVDVDQRDVSRLVAAG